MATNFFLELDRMRIDGIDYRDSIHLAAVEAECDDDLIRIDIDRYIGREAGDEKEEILAAGLRDFEARKKFGHGDGVEAMLFTPKQARLLARALLLAADDIDASIDSKNE